MSTPWPAATVVLLRSVGDGLEVLLTHRPATMAFAPDVHVFPGGRVDEADADPSLLARSVLSAEDAAAALGGDLATEPSLAAYVAAIRETFEEVGVLLEDHAPGADVASARARLLARSDVARPGLFPEIAEDLDLRLRTDWLVPLSRWVTPPTLERRFDARFFAAALPEGAEVSLVGDEVVAQAWHRPIDALESIAAGRIDMWLPTSTTLMQLEHVRSIDEIRSRLAPGRLGEIVVEDVVEGIVRIEMPAGGGVAGQPVNAYLVGRASFVLVDPGDPTGPGLDRGMAEAGGRGGPIEAVVLTQASPDHAAGAEALREMLGIPVYVGPGRGRHLPSDRRDLANGDVVREGDVGLRAILTPGPAIDHVAFVVGEGGVVLSGDLDGVRGARSVLPPSDEVAWERSVARLLSAAPAARWLGGHPPR